MCLVRLWILENTPLTLSKPVKSLSLFPQISVVLTTHLLHVSCFILVQLNIQCFNYYKSGSTFCAPCIWMDMIFLSLGMFPSMILLKICYISLTYYSSSFSRPIIWDLFFLTVSYIFCIFLSYYFENSHFLYIFCLDPI